MGIIIDKKGGGVRERERERGGGRERVRKREIGEGAGRNWFEKKLTCC